MFCMTGFKPKARDKKAGAGDSCFFQYLCGESVFAGRSAQFLPAVRFRRSLFGFADDAADSLRQSPLASIPKLSLPDAPRRIRRPGSRYSGVGSFVSRSLENGGNSHGAISITGRARALPINEILYQCCSHHLTISSTHQQGGSPTPVDAIL